MAETLLTGSTVYLFGRVLEDIRLVRDADRKRGLGRNILANALGKGNARLARIYAFAFQSEVVVLNKPAAFLVHGRGERMDIEKCLLMDGLSVPDDLRVWPYDRADITLRLDIMTGTFDSLLLDYELGRGGLQDAVRGGHQVGSPSPLGATSPRGRGRRWRPDDE